MKKVTLFLLAFALLFLASRIYQWPFLPEGLLPGLISFLLTTAVLSIGLGLFNLLPIPPLDGSKVLFALLPEGAYYTLMRYERYGMAVLLLLVWLDVGSNALSRGIYLVYQWMMSLLF